MHMHMLAHTRRLQRRRNNQKQLLISIGKQGHEFRGHIGSYAELLFTRWCIGVQTLVFCALCLRFGLTVRTSPPYHLTLFQLFQAGISHIQARRSKSSGPPYSHRRIRAKTELISHAHMQGTRCPPHNSATPSQLGLASCPLLQHLQVASHSSALLGNC